MNKISQFENSLKGSLSLDFPYMPIFYDCQYLGISDSGLPVYSDNVTGDNFSIPDDRIGDFIFINKLGNTLSDKHASECMNNEFVYKEDIQVFFVATRMEYISTIGYFISAISKAGGCITSFTSSTPEILRDYYGDAQAYNSALSRVRSDATIFRFAVENFFKIRVGNCGVPTPSCTPQC